MNKLNRVNMEISTKFENSELVLNEKLQLIKKTIYEYEHKMKTKAEKDFA